MGFIRAANAYDEGLLRRSAFLFAMFCFTVSAFTVDLSAETPESTVAAPLGLSPSTWLTVFVFVFHFGSWFSEVRSLRTRLAHVEAWKNNIGQTYLSREVFEMTVKRLDDIATHLQERIDKMSDSSLSPDALVDLRERIVADQKELASMRRWLIEMNIEIGSKVRIDRENDRG